MAAVFVLLRDVQVLCRSVVCTTTKTPFEWVREAVPLHPPTGCLGLLCLLFLLLPFCMAIKRLALLWGSAIAAATKLL